MGRVGAVFWQVEAGLDLSDHYSEIAPLAHLGVGLGYDAGAVDVSGETVTLLTNRDAAGFAGAPDNLNTTAALGARFKSDHVSPGLAVVFPIRVHEAEDRGYSAAVLLDVSALLP
jgi:hypothetical protein